MDQALPKWIISGLIVTGLLITGCTTNPFKRPATLDIEKEKLAAAPPLSAIREEGSLWSPVSASNFYSDLKARNVGDTVTIKIVETASASKNAETKTGRNSGLKANWSGILDALARGWTVGGAPVGPSHLMDLSNYFDGKGETSRSSSMTAFITARVTHVMPNGNLLIQGTRSIQLNRETQYISIQGIIRPEDVSSTNVILSTYVADAVIELDGYGVIGDKQSPGWLARVIDWVWPF